MAGVRLRPLRREDLPLLEAAEAAETDPLNFFGFSPSERRERRFAENGLISDERGNLAVVAFEGTLLGVVSWITVQHGPTSACQALNLGITLLPEHRGRGYGTEAQRLLAEYLLATRTVERLEAGTDVENVAEQRALERAGFRREGVLRHAHFRAGAWHDVVLYSRLRDDPS